jgi:hypothetical protein
MSYRLPLLAAGFITIFAASAVVAQDVEYTLINSSSATLLEFYTSPVTDDTWGGDLLAFADIRPGAAGSVMIGDGRASCAYDLLFVFDDGTELTDTVDICRLASYELTD